MSSKARCCRHCVYANVLRDGMRTLAICANTPESPGQIVRIDPSGCCRNFRPRGRRKPRTVPPEPPTDEVRYIPLTEGKYPIVDAGDYEWLSRYQWYAAQTGCGLCYAATNVDGKTVFMHRLIMDAPKGKVVDHIDGDGLVVLLPPGKAASFRLTGVSTKDNSLKMEIVSDILAT